MTSTLCRIPQGTPVLVTGATGFTGVKLTRKLVDAGLRVTAVARKTSNLSPLSDLEINWVRGEVYDAGVIAEAASGQSYIFHLAAAFREAKGTEKDYWNVHVKSTMLLVEEAMKNPNFERYVHASTIGVHGHIADPPATETYPFNPDDDYQRTKLQAEQWLTAFAAKTDFPFTIIRPASIYGPGDKRLLKLFKMALAPVFPVLGKGKLLFHLVHVEDLTNTFIIAATHPDTLGEAIISGAEEPISTPDIARIIAMYFGKKLRIVRLPIGPFFVAADLCEAICRPFKIEPPIFRRRVAFYSKDRHFDVSKMKETLGYHPIYSNKEGIIETARWYVDQGWLKGKGG